MKIRNIKLAFAAALLVALGACDGGALTGPEAEIEDRPVAKNACQTGGEVARRAGCMVADPEEEGQIPGQPLDEYNWFVERR